MCTVFMYGNIYNTLSGKKVQLLEIFDTRNISKEDSCRLF